MLGFFVFFWGGAKLRMLIFSVSVIVFMYCDI